MLKINTITCHHVYNYGASLQAFALQNYLESQKNDVTIIDYRLDCHKRYEFFNIDKASRFYPLYLKLNVLKYILGPISNRSMLKTFGRKKSFDKFDRDFLKLTSATYRTIEELKKNYPIADIYIAGSDQIWNTYMPNGTDLGYYLDFGETKTKRVSYAASFGSSTLKNGTQDFVRKQLSKFDKISVRESSGLTILNQLQLKGCNVVDPVFLLNKDEWIKKLKLNRKDEDYILLYDFLHLDNNIKEFTLKLAARTHLKIISINDYSNTPYADIQINDAGPVEFLTYLLNAKYIVSNSFHATAFSIIFNKQFVTFPLSTLNNSSRITDLLSDLTLPERYAPSSIETILKYIDWNAIMPNYFEKIKESKSFLQQVYNANNDK